MSTRTSKNLGRDVGWYKASNVLTDKWARILGPQPFFVYHIMKSMCISDPTVTSPQACQQDWAEWCGLGVQVFERALKKLVAFGLVDKIAPGNPTHAMVYEVRDLATIPIPQNLFESVKPLSKENRFHDPLFEQELWQQNMYRESKIPRIKRIIRSHLNAVSEARTVMGNGTRTVMGNGTIVRLNDSKTEQILPKGSIRGSDEPHQFLHDSFSEDTGWVLVSHYHYKEEFPQEEVHCLPKKSSFMSDRIRKTLSPKSNNATHRTKTEHLPPLQEMPQSMQVWYNLPLVSKPKIKVYKRNLSYLQKLTQGQFPTEYKNLKSDWTHQKGQQEITRKHLDRSWSDEEIAHLLDGAFRRILTDIAYWPQNKEKYFKGLSFESFLFNAYSGRSWLLELAYREPQLEKSVHTKQILDHDPYPDCTYEIAEALEINQKLNPETYAGIAGHFSRIVQFFRLLPVQEGHERDGIFKFVNHPQTLAYSLAEFLRQKYSWVTNPGAGLISLKGKPIRQWLEEWNDQYIRMPGRKKPSCIWDLLDEYNQYGKLRIMPTTPEDSTQTDLSTPIQEDLLFNKQAEEVELKRREEEAVTHVAPEDIIYAEGEKPKKGAMWPKIKAALARIKQGIPDPVVDESYAGF